MKQDHDCKQEEKIDKVLDICTRLDVAVCGSEGSDGLHKRVKRLEDGVPGIIAFCLSVGAIIGGTFVWLSKIIRMI